MSWSSTTSKRFPRRIDGGNIYLAGPRRRSMRIAPRNMGTSGSPEDNSRQGTAGPAAGARSSGHYRHGHPAATFMTRSNYFMWNRFRNSLLSAALVLLAALPVAAAEHHGQVTFGGLPLPGATVTLTQGDKKMTAVTDAEGVYSFT